MAKRYENETYIEWYARNLGSIHSYPEMTPEQLGRKASGLQRELGATLVYLRHDPDSLAGNEMLKMIEPHYEAALKESRRRTFEATA